MTSRRLLDIARKRKAELVETIRHLAHQEDSPEQINNELKTIQALEPIKFLNKEEKSLLYSILFPEELLWI